MTGLKVMERLLRDGRYLVAKKAAVLQFMKEATVHSSLLSVRERLQTATSQRVRVPDMPERYLQGGICSRSPTMALSG